MEQRRRDLHVDFNNAGPDGICSSLVRYATPGSVIKDAHRITVGDDDGNRCRATVIFVDPKTGLVSLRLDWSTWRPAPVLSTNPEPPR